MRRCDLFTFPNFCELFESLLLSITSTNGNRKGTRTKLEKQNIRLTAKITDYLCLFFDFRGIRWPLAFPGHVRRYILQYINEIAVLPILSTILNRKYLDSTRFAYMRFSLSFLHALLEMKCNIQISYEMVSNALVHQLTVCLYVQN